MYFFAVFVYTFHVGIYLGIVYKYNTTGSASEYTVKCSCFTVNNMSKMGSIKCCTRFLKQIFWLGIIALEPSHPLRLEISFLTIDLWNAFIKEISLIIWEHSNNRHETRNEITFLYFLSLCVSPVSPFNIIDLSFCTFVWACDIKGIYIYTETFKSNSINIIFVNEWFEPPSIRNV